MGLNFFSKLETVPKMGADHRPAFQKWETPWCRVPSESHRSVLEVPCRIGYNHFGERQKAIAKYLKPGLAQSICH